VCAEPSVLGKRSAVRREHCADEFPQRYEIYSPAAAEFGFVPLLHIDFEIAAFCRTDFDENVTTFYKLLRDKAGYHTMVTGRDDLDKSSGGPGIDGMKHTDKLGFSDSVRCDGSTGASQRNESTVGANQRCALTVCSCACGVAQT
jgi:hypothetical protein